MKTASPQPLQDWRERFDDDTDWCFGASEKGGHDSDVGDQLKAKLTEQS